MLVRLRYARRGAVSVQKHNKRSGRDNPLWVNSQTATLHSQLRCPGLRGASSDRPFAPVDDDEVQSLCQEGQLDRALDALLRMDEQGTVPSVDVYRSLLKACTKKKALHHAKRVYAHLAHYGLEVTRFLGESVVNSFVKCGGLEYGLHVFHRLPNRTVVSWTAVISGYAQVGKLQEALRLFQSMGKDGVHPNSYTFVTLLKACASISDLELGRRVHADIVKYGCETDLFVTTCLVHMYAQCQSILEAQTVFDGLLQKDVVLWNAMLAGYAQQGQGENVLELYHHMQEDLSPGCRTFVSVIQGCGNLAEKEDVFLVDGQLLKPESLQKVKAIHFEARRRGYESDDFVGNALVDIYGKCGSIEEAQTVFDGLLRPDIVSWNSMLTACAQQGQAERTLALYEQMVQDSIVPDDRSFVSVLQACGILAEREKIVVVDDLLLRLKALQQGKLLHEEAYRNGYSTDAFVGNSLLNLYGKCGSIRDSQHEFDKLLQRDVVSWNSMLTAYIQQGEAEKAFQLYQEMSVCGVTLDDRTLVSALQACGRLAENENTVTLDGQLVKVESLQTGKAMHSEALRWGFQSDIFVGSTLISFYGKCGSVVDAQNVFKGLSQQNVVSWTAMLSAYAQQGQGEKALQLYGQMLREGVSPNETTLVSVLQACGQTGALDLCVAIHRKLALTIKDLSPLLATTLISAYGRCAKMEDAQEIIDALAQTDAATWNALVAGYVRQGDFERSIRCYDEMQLAGVKPNSITFLLLLSVCSHAGRVDIGIAYFEVMSRGHGINPEAEHYASLVDLLGRAGHFTMVENVLKQMPVQPDLFTWLCLLGACRKHSNVVLGRHAFDCAVQLGSKCAAAYVLMSNLYAHTGMWDCAKEVDELRQKAGAWKKPGQSWIEHEQEVHAFLVGDREHQQQGQMFDLSRKLSVERESQFATHVDSCKRCLQTLHEACHSDESIELVIHVSLQQNSGLTPHFGNGENGLSGTRLSNCPT